MIPLLILVLMMPCDAQHQEKPQGRCDEVRVLRFSTPCASCAVTPTLLCPGGSRKITKDMGTANCTYTVNIGGHSKQLPGCRHTCERKVTEHRCCPETWGPLCLPCPSWSGRVCNWHGTCMDGANRNGTCVCEEGFTGFACQECKNKNTYGEHCTSVCTCVHGECNHGPSGNGECYCQPPYTGPRCDQESQSCRNCSLHSYCKQTGGTATCKCLPGFKKTGLTCTGAMCSLNVCDENAECTELGPRRYQCRCNAGYEGNGRVCAPLNPCTTDNGGCPTDSTICVYTSPGRSRCVCKRGYEGSTPEMGCRLKSACTESTCHRTARCQTDQNGLPTCTCEAEQIGDGRRCYGNILERVLELDREGPMRGNLTGAIQLFEKGCQLTLSKHGPFTAFIPLLRQPLPSVSERFLCRQHLVPGQKILNQLQGNDFWTLGGEQLRFRDDKTFLFVKSPYTFYSVVQSDIPAANGIIHIINGPITNIDPGTSDNKVENKTIGEILASHPKYSSFQSLVDNCGVPLHLNGAGPLTVFVPTNEAVDKLSDGTLTYLLREGKHKLQELLKYHVFPGAMVTVEELMMKAEVQTMASVHISVSCSEDGRILVDGVPLHAADVFAANGIIHLINGVLAPNTITPLLPHRCDVAESRINVGECVSCTELQKTQCPPGSTELEIHYKGCMYQHLPNVPLYSMKGCAKYCNTTITRMECCKGFYGEDCKPCVGGFQHPCHDKGQCRDGIHGDGSCICMPLFTGMDCQTCVKENKYGENCDEDCLCVHGVCDNRRDSKGLCKKGSCQKGYWGDLCDLMEMQCSSDHHLCHYQASCIYDPERGSTQCVCHQGYEGDGVTCVPANPCLRPDRGGCDRNAQCAYDANQGNTSCVCGEGWTGDGTVCTPINNCLLASRGDCHQHADCRYLGPGQSDCECMSGFRGDGTHCEPVNPCHYGNGGCHILATCTFSGNETHTCKCADGYSGNGTICYGSILMELDGKSEFYRFEHMLQKTTPIIAGLDGKITALVPSYKAFRNLSREERDFWMEPYRLPYLLKAHFLEGVFSSEDLIQRANQKVATLNPKISWEVKNISGEIMVGRATITAADHPATNGYLHVIDKILLPPVSSLPPPPLTLMGFLNHAPAFSLFRQAFLLYNVTALMADMKKFTLLLPSDKAIKEHFSRTNSTELDEDLVKYHIVVDALLFPDDLMNGMTKKTLLGSSYYVMFHAGSKNESMVNEVVLSGNFTEIMYGVVMVIPQVLEIHKNFCFKEVFTKVGGWCGPCDEAPKCFYSGKPAAAEFPPGMKSNCRYRKRVGTRRRSAPGCVMDCLRPHQEVNCCPGYFGHSCHKCPGRVDSWCSGHGQCQDGIFGSGECVCHEGFNGTACEDCAPGRYGPQCKSECNCNHGRCVDGVNGDGRCLCFKGWKGPTCSVEIVADECGGICDQNANCVTGVAGKPATCSCVAGYQGNGTVCKEIELCGHGNGGCSLHANCTRVSPGVRKCTCHAGYSGDGVVCEELNACTSLQNICHEKAECLQTGPGQVICRCMEGYSGSGLFCHPVNPCRKNNGGCSMHAWCEFRGPGQYNCTCRRGYSGDGITCKGNIMIEIMRHPNAYWFYNNLRKSKINDLHEKGPFTAFIPHTDYINNFTMEPWTDAGRSGDLLRYHLVSCEQMLMSDLQSIGQVFSLSGHSLRFSKREGVTYINDEAKIITSDETVYNGVIHFIDRVLVPYDLQKYKMNPSKWNVSAAAEAYGYSTFSKLIQEPSLQSLVQNVLHHPLTMLWPTDEVFRSLPEERRAWLFSPEQAETLASYVKAHIIRNGKLAAANLPSMENFRTMFGSTLTFGCDKKIVGDIVVDGGNAKIIERHLQFDVGIAYGINQLLEPPGLGAHCNIFREMKIPGRCESCLLTPHCPFGMTFTGEISSCMFSRPWRPWRNYGYFSPSRPWQLLDTEEIPGCRRECGKVQLIQKCCKNHYGKDCQACPGGLEAPCSNHGDCDDGQQGTGGCTCQPGFTGTACELCESHHYGPNCTACVCSQNGRCEDGLDGDGSCFCQEGWTGARCELKLGEKPVCAPACHPAAVCQPGNLCQCQPLYVGDGRNCTALDLCSDYNGGCHQQAECVQTGVNITCTCLPGYTGDGVTCSPIDRCVQEANGGCSEFANCIFTGPNERRCECLPGYVGNGVQCLEKVVPPVDRCLLDNGGCDPKANCKDLHFHENTAGVFHLSSPDGRYKLTYKKAQEACQAEGATLATFSQMSDAQQLGMHLCTAGWLDKEQVGYPIRYPSPNCGNNHVGVVLYKEPVDTSSTYDAYCYRVKDVSCECGSGYVGDGDFCNGHLASIVATNANFSHFYSSLLKYASTSKQGEALMSFLSTPSTSVTLFVPQNSGFNASKPLTWRDVEYHLTINNTVHLYGNLAHGTELQSRLGFSLSVTVSAANAGPSNASHPTKLVNKVQIVDWDIPATNGIIHVIEGPLQAPPPNTQPKVSQSTLHSQSSGTTAVLTVCLLIAAGIGLVYYFLRNRKDPFRFHYFKSEEEEEEACRSQEEGCPPLVSIPNPVYNSSPSAADTFQDAPAVEMSDSRPVDD
ncbi:hypothetical protein MATL_G00113920 [Megalops atlanticus]|uniref:Uncharacterized protein n=1 Tax=Megalops atlanticus TaxID=7932 RepID=A0A9D3Q090_MEGAT|nr:hypothetical protein MATL_G00113920 [Megalops atlanticus]